MGNRSVPGISVVLSLFLLARCGGEVPMGEDALTFPLHVAGQEVAEEETEAHQAPIRPLRCGESLNAYTPISERASAVLLSGAKRICKEKLRRKANRRTRCAASGCGEDSCQPDSSLRGTTYDCQISGDSWDCKCRPTTIRYRCTSC